MQGMKLTDRILAAQQDGGRWSHLQDSTRHHDRARRVLTLLGNIDDSSWHQEALVALLRADGLKDSSINRYLSVLDGLDYSVEYLRFKQAEPRTLTDIEVQSLDARVRAYPDADACKAVYALLRDTGCRGLTEMARLDWTKVRWDKPTVTWESFKGSGDDLKERTVPLTEVAFKALSWLYHNPPLPTHTEWRKFWLKVRLDDQNKPYDLRHTFCTRLLDKGIPPASVMKIMGHSDLSMTMRYYHQTPASLAAARDALML